MKLLLFVSMLVFLHGFYACQTSSIDQEAKKLPSDLIAAKGGKFYGDTLKVNSTEAITSLFPAAIIDIYSQHISSQIYEGLVKFNAGNLTIEPCLAKSYTIDSSNSVYTFNLRNDVYFHNSPCFSGGNGRLMTAKDVQFVFEFLCSNHPLNTSPVLWRNYVKGGHEFYLNKTSHVSGITVLNDSTIQVKLNESFSGFLNILALTQTAIFPKEALDYYGDKLNSEFAVGTGPFILKSTNDHIFLQKNTRYYQFDQDGNQLPFLSYIDIQFNNDKTLELNDFKAGNIDFIWGLPVEEIQNVIGSLEDAKEGRNKEFTLQSINNLQVEYYAFSMKDSLLKNIHLRKALNFAIDKSYIANYLLEGSVLPATDGFIPEILGYDNSKISGYAFNPAKARAELALSGYNPRKDEQKITLFYNNSGQINQLVANEIKKQLKKNLGIDLVLDESDRQSFFKKIDSGKLPFWRYGWIADYPDPANFMASFHSKNIGESSNNSNKAQFSNYLFDKYFDEAMAENNTEKRMQLLAEAEQILINEAALLPLFHFTSIRLVNPKLKGFPINKLEFRDYSKVYFSNTRKKNVRVYENIETVEVE